MTNSLSKRYTSGNFGYISSSTPEGDFFYGIPSRQKDLISLAKQQIQAQEVAADRIIQSNIESADLIVREINEQTLSLSNSIENAGDQVSTSIDILGDRLCGELGEIRWELEQQRGISEKMLAVLQHPRSTEAKELIHQGLRHLLNVKYKEAKERFRLALDLDNTDYQVLMNLSYIALHDNNGQEAIRFLNDALTLPENLDNQSKADALWSLARVYYALEQYSPCYSYACKSISISENPRRLFQTGVYAVLHGLKEKGIESIERAIIKDISLFPLAVTEPDINPIKNDILTMLNKLSNNSFLEAKKSVENIDREITFLGKTKNNSNINTLIDTVKTELNKIKVFLGEPSYSRCINSMKNLKIIEATLSNIYKVDSLYSQSNSIELEIKSKEDNLNIAEQNLSIKQDIPVTLEEANYYSRLKLNKIEFMLLYLGLGFLLLLIIPTALFNSSGVAIFWPIALPLGILMTMIKDGVSFFWVLEYITISAALIFILYKIKDKQINTLSSSYKSSKDEFKYAESAKQNSIFQLTDISNQIETSISNFNKDIEMLADLNAQLKK